MKKVMGMLGRGTAKTAEVIGVGVVELPKLVLIGSKYAGKGIEQVGRGIAAGSQVGIDGLNTAQDAIESKSNNICSTLSEWENRAEVPPAPAEDVVVAVPVDDTVACPDCGQECKGETGLAIHVSRAHCQTETAPAPA